MSAPVKGENILVAVDGSSLSERGFQISVALRHRDDKMVVLHVHDSSKDDALPPKYKSSYIENAYNVACVSSIPKDKFRIILQEKDPDQLARVQIVKYANQIHAALLVVGYYGKKGPKKDTNLLGGTTDFSIRQSNCSVLIVKELRPVPKDSAKWVVAVDGSDRSQQAFLEAVRYMRADDTVVVLTVYDPNTADQAKEAAIENLKYRYEQLLRQYKVRGSFVAAEGRNEADTIADKCEQLEADFLVIGADGMSAFLEHKRFLGSVSDVCIRKCKCHVMVVKQQTV